MTVTEIVPGTQVDAVMLGGRYRLAQRVGGTGETTSWRATDELLRRTVAVHLLPAWRPVRPSVPEAVQAGAGVNDPRLATIFDADYRAENPYIVSEWAGDPNLEDLLLAGLPSPALAALIVSEAAAALTIAHAEGQPHLCLGLRNVHWGGSGLKITGLGIDAALSGADATDPAAADTAALARILYALLTGYWPGDSALRPGTRLYEPRQIRPGIPSILNAITCHALPGQPGWGRPSISGPAELAAALRSAQQAMRGSAPRPALVPPSVPEATVRETGRHTRTSTCVGRRPMFAGALG